MFEALFIVLSLGTLEVVLWLLDRRELMEQTKLLEDILVTLADIEPSGGVTYNFMPRKAIQQADGEQP